MSRLDTWSCCAPHKLWIPKLARSPKSNTIQDGFATGLADRLRERVYHQTVPALAAAVAARIQDTQSKISVSTAPKKLPNSQTTRTPVTNDLNPGGGLASRVHNSSLTEADLRRAYEQVMVVLFRLLFTAYAEATDLLPL